ncbi:Rne/Rng family ribonuclease [Bacillus carboniphilus]|uniref:Rne/Rng family ribonuclease n=1 Tax=Bacillus carboniphilus TaxID=86663 RepID=A0ABY9JXL1_9BACI|nr:Rne/Rng family ribonuclease [Bacillus carboniphilus]WLR44080.1 Rne/Rng family ribonuclease [Bacillus carboniphilus]
MQKQLYIEMYHQRERVIVVEKNQLTDVFIAEKNDNQHVGQIFKGRVKKVLPGMQAAFVDIGNSKNAYLHLDDLYEYQKWKNEKYQSVKDNIRHHLTEGQEIIVQVLKEGDEQKAPKLTTKIELSSIHFVYQPYGNHLSISKKVTDHYDRERLLKLLNGRGGGWIIRTAALQQTNDTLICEIEELKKKFNSIEQSQQTPPCCLHKGGSFPMQIVKELSPTNIEKIVCNSRTIYHQLKESLSPFNHIEISYLNRETFIDFEHDVEKVKKRVVWLKSGASIVFDEVEAMTVIDVNTAKFSGKSSYTQTIVKTNEEAAKEIVKQIKLRNISGIILIDFIDMKDRNDKEKILNVLERHLKNDPVHTKILGFTALNILEITRKKTRKSLLEQTSVKCPLCQGVGMIKAPKEWAFELERELFSYQNRDCQSVIIDIHERVMELFDDNYKSFLEDKLGFFISFIPSSQVGYSIRRINT